MNEIKYEYTSSKLPDGTYEVQRNGICVGFAMNFVKAGELIEKLSAADRERDKAKT